MKNCIIFALCLFMATACTPKQNRSSAPAEQKTLTFTPPVIPTYMTNPEDQAGYFVLQYWDNFDFTDTTMKEDWTNMVEDAFVNYINAFPYASQQLVQRSIGNLLDKAFDGSRQMYDHFTDLFEKYFYDPNSPFRQEDFYILVLRHIVGSEKLDELDKLRSRSHLEMALKNRPGDIATDFEYTLANGNKGRLSNVLADRIILFFNNPDCPDCMRVKEVLKQLNIQGVKVVAIYPDDDIESWRAAEYPANWINGYNYATLRANNLYDLKAIPTLYLLNSDRRVVLKDAPVEYIMNFLYQ